MLEDRLLIWKFRRGDKNAFRAIYDKYAGDLLTLAGNLLNDKVGAEDIVQDAFIALAESIETFRLTGSLKGYLTTCVANRSRDEIRKSKRQRTAVANKAENEASEATSAVYLAIRSEQMQRVSHALTDLPYEQREVIVLRLHGDLRFRQIAKLQRTSIKTVQSRYRYGLDKLRSILNGEVKNETSREY